jgi:hypothetical protein
MAHVYLQCKSLRYDPVRNRLPCILCGIFLHPKIRLTVHSVQYLSSQVAPWDSGGDSRSSGYFFRRLPVMSVDHAVNYALRAKFEAKQQQFRYVTDFYLHFLLFRQILLCQNIFLTIRIQ